MAEPVTEIGVPVAESLQNKDSLENLL